MSPHRSPGAVLRAVVLSFLVPAALAQAPESAAPPTPAQLEAELNGKAVESLLAFARQAESAKMRARAKAAYELVLGYDPEQRAARTAFGFRKEKGAWVEAAAGKQQWLDAPTTAQLRQRVTTGWEQLQKQLAALHRTLGLQLQAGSEQAAATRHLTMELLVNGVWRCGVRAPAGIELLPDGTWDCGSSGGSWSGGECGCGSGAASSCGPCECDGDDHPRGSGGGERL